MNMATVECKPHGKTVYDTRSWLWMQDKFMILMMKEF